MLHIRAIRSVTTHKSHCRNLTTLSLYTRGVYLEREGRLFWRWSSCRCRSTDRSWTPGAVAASRWEISSLCRQWETHLNTSRDPRHHLANDSLTTTIVTDGSWRSNSFLTSSTIFASTCILFDINRTTHIFQKCRTCKVSNAYFSTIWLTTKCYETSYCRIKACLQHIQTLPTLHKWPDTNSALEAINNVTNCLLVFHVSLSLSFPRTRYWSKIAKFPYRMCISLPFLGWPNPNRMAYDVKPPRVTYCLTMSPVVSAYYTRVRRTDMCRHHIPRYVLDVCVVQQMAWNPLMLRLCGSLKILERARCNPWPHVANRRMSISQLLSMLLLIYGFKFRSAFLH